MIWQRLNALKQKSQQPLEGDSHRPTNAAQRYPLHQQACNQRSGVLRDEVLFEAIDKLTSTIFALMILLAIVDVTVFLILG